MRNKYSASFVHWIPNLIKTAVCNVPPKNLKLSGTFITNTPSIVDDQIIDTNLIDQLKKQHKVAIFLKHKEKYNTVVIRGIEKNLRALFEVREQLLESEDAETPICCEKHDPNSLLVNSKSTAKNLTEVKPQLHRNLSLD